MTVRTYCRRSKNDEGKQQFSLDVQANGCTELIQRMGAGDQSRRDYVDDGRAGDDFLTRAGLRQLLADAQRGDIIVCRDQSRLGRDAIEVTLVIRDLVRDRGCRLFYYATGQEVQFANAIDQATTFIQGTGHQMELEAIRSRTREALRSRVRNGQVAGGSCYGYTLERKTDAVGRKYTTARVNEQEAPVVRRIFVEYLANRGIKAIAHQLNEEGVPAPAAGRRGSGSWAPGAIRSILLNPRYRGVYIHGRIKKLRQGGGTIRVKAEPHELITLELPEWRIVDDATWFAVAERFTTRGPQPRSAIENGAKYALSGLARCQCGGAIVVTRVRAYGGGRTRMKTYSCHRHHDRGSAVCPITIHQPIEEVETLLIDHIREHVLTPEMLDDVLANVRAEIEAQMPQHDADLKALEAELGDMKAEQKRLAKAVAISNDIPELMTELKQRLNRINHLETQIAAAKRTPAERAKLIVQLEKTVKARLTDVRAALSDRRDLREILMALFPSGLQFTPARTSDGARQVWRMRGAANYRALDCARPSPVQSESGPGGKKGSGPGPRNRADCAELVSWSNPNCDPDGIRTRVTGVKGRCPRPSGRRGLIGICVSPEGFEPSTLGLKGRCSTD
jgi:site-specific DNA recombinase